MAELARRRLGTTELLVAELGLGTVTFADSADESASREILARYQGAGGNLVDTADVYGDGRTEELLGRLLAGRRDDVVLVTKAGMASSSAALAGGGARHHLLAAAEASLRRLRTDRIDLFQVHVPDPTTAPEETLAALDELVRSGKVRHIGASNFAGWQLAKALGISARTGGASYVALEAQYSLVARDLEVELLPLCREEGVAVLAYAPLAGGILSGKYAGDPLPGSRLADSPHTAHPLSTSNQELITRLRAVASQLGATPSQVALRWVLDQPGVVSAIVGARAAGQLDENLAVAGLALDPGQAAVLAGRGPRLPYPQSLHRMLGCEPTVDDGRTKRLV